MKSWVKRFTALLLLLSVLLSGCAIPDFGGFWQDLQSALQNGLAASFSDMEYARPDPDAVFRQISTTSSLAQTETNVDRLMDEIYTCYELYYDFYTNYMLSNIYYCTDMTDIYWEGEYAYCLEQSAGVDAAMDGLLYDLADSPLRQQLEQDAFFGEGFFSAYEGDSIWDETFTALMDQESALLSRYYDLSAQSVAEQSYSDAYFQKWGTQLETLFVELVALRQQIAEYAGYEDYVSFAYDFYYYRDYTPQQASDFLSQIQATLPELYISLPDDVWEAGYSHCSQQQSLQYVAQFSEKMGGTVFDAFQLMQNSGLYNNTISSKKYNASFEVYLPSYFTPYVFLNPQGTAGDKLTFAHEFGHFCSDYAASGSIAGIDVAEVFSQAMEYLSLCYSEDTQALSRMKLADSLCLMVEQSAYASFEHQVYLLEGEALTAENVRALYETIGRDYGFTSWGWDSRDYVMIPHFFTNPLYVISYVVSNDAAMQIYQAELTQTGAGLALLEENLATEQAYFLAFVAEAGLKSPFRSGRAEELADIFHNGI